MKANKNIHPIKFIDLFSGCGGLSEGFLNCGGYELIGCVEWEKKPLDTHFYNYQNSEFFNNDKEKFLWFDIQRIDELISGWKKDPDYKDGIGLDHLVEKYGKPNIIIGGPPCQAYSIAGRVRDENGMEDDYRNYLFESYLKIVDQYKPDLFVFENVPGILSAKPGGISIIERITKSFQEIGYVIDQNLRGNALIDFTEFGIPQNRSRVIIIGINASVFNLDPEEELNRFYTEILPKYKSGKVNNVRNAIFDLPKFFPAEQEYKIKGKKFSHFPEKSSIPNHFPRYHNSRDIQIFRDLAFDLENGNRKYNSIESIKRLYWERTGKSSNVHKYFVLRWDEPSNLIPAHLYKDGLRHIHPDSQQARSLTVRECARLQTFTDEFKFFGSMGDQYKMIGNAVPPRFSLYLAKAIRELFY